jgi:hypothetical protein
MRRLVSRTKPHHICKHRVAVTRTETVTGAEAETEALASSLLPAPARTKSRGWLKHARPQRPPATLFPVYKRSLVAALRPVT